MRIETITAVILHIAQSDSKNRTTYLPWQAKDMYLLTTGTNLLLSAKHVSLESARLRKQVSQYGNQVVLTQSLIIYIVIKRNVNQG